MYLTFFGRALLCLVTFYVVVGLDEEAIKERRCLNPPPAPAKNIDFKWALSVDLYYFNHGSQLDLYRIASEIKETPISEIKHDEFYYDSCMITTLGTEGLGKVQGFDGKKCEFKVEPVREGVFKFISPISKKTLTSHITLTDNKTFILFTNCWEDDEASWGVISTTKNLNEKIKNRIFKHIKKLGFDEKYFTYIRYETCKEIQVGKDEL